MKTVFRFAVGAALEATGQGHLRFPLSIYGRRAMSAYIIFTRETTLDEQELAKYAKEAPATLVGHEVKAIAFYGARENLEGPVAEGTVIMEFSNVTAAKAWYESSLYRKVRERRFNGAIYRSL